MKLDRINAEIDQLITDGEAILLSRRVHAKPGVVYMDGPPEYVDLQAFAKWQAGCAHLMSILGKSAEHWRKQFEYSANSPVAVQIGIGTLKAIKDAIQKGLLLKIEDLIMAETFENILEQADYLLSQSYYLAGGVLGRCVLEEHLRKHCELKNCTPSKAKPTLEDYNQSLYKDQLYNATELKNITSLIDIGNLAAHNKPELTKESVERLLREVRSLLLRIPLN